MSPQIRMSQFVVTYGPGAILETGTGPRVIPRPDIGLFNPNSGMRPIDYAISDQRMSQGLLGGARVFRLPSNAERGVLHDQPLYMTRPFPIWRLCLNFHGHGGDFSVLFPTRNCPVCHLRSNEQEPSRFIVACPEGHMDDIDWYRLVHHSQSNCQQSEWFRWRGGGGALRDIELDCSRCGSTERFGDVYSQPWPCHGRFPEQELLMAQPGRSPCARPAKIIQRQATNLRVPILRTLFTIQPRHTRLHLLLQQSHIYSYLVGSGTNVSESDFRRALGNFLSGRVISRATHDEILRSPWDEIAQAISDVLTHPATSYRELLLEEMNAMIEGSVTGVPPVHGPAPSSPVIFEIDPNLVQRFPSTNRRIFRVVPIPHLRTVTAQTGYRREVDTQRPAARVDVGFHDPSNPLDLWYPGVEFHGEGIFVMLDSAHGWHYQLAGDACNRWQSALNSHSGYPEYVFRDPVHDEFHPVFVWWHTLSHLLIRSLSIEAGYSTASIRERVYLEREGSRSRGGILMYATQPGSEGTLGGLIALGPHFDEILAVAVDMLRACSSDPICFQNRFETGHYNGAACYGCSLISETCCEHRNMWLDRTVLLDNLP